MTDGPGSSHRWSPSHLSSALLAVLLAGTALMGWVLAQPLLTTFVEGRPALSPMTAIGLLIAAAAVAALPHRNTAALILGTTQLLLGGFIVASHLLGWSAQFGLPIRWWSSPFTGALLAVSGAGSVLLATGHFTTGQVLSFAVLLFAALMGLAHVFPQADLYKVLPGTGVAIPTILGLASISVSQITACRSRGIAGALASRSLVGRTGRRLLFGGIGTVLALCVLIAALYRFDALDAESAVLLTGWVAIAVLGTTLWGLAVAVDRAELARLDAERTRDQQRDMVMAALSHDLRSPLQAAAMSTVLLQRLVTDEQASRTVERLQRSHRRIDRMLRSLLDNLTLESGQSLHLHAQEVALHEVVAEVVAENAALLEARVAWEGQAHGWWDRDALYRVVENLLLNAAKYGTPLTPVWCRITTGKRDVALTVENHGAAIPAEQWEGIFVPFRRGVHSSGRLPGWGVGLAFARDVLGRHGGSIRVARSDDELTVFELRLPMDSRAALEVGEPPQSLAAD